MLDATMHIIGSNSVIHQDNGTGAYYIQNSPTPTGKMLNFLLPQL